jgi:hypothetical protein
MSYRTILSAVEAGLWRTVKYENTQLEGILRSVDYGGLHLVYNCRDVQLRTWNPLGGETTTPPSALGFRTLFGDAKYVVEEQ